jgi:hypothetical protein
MKKAEEAPRDEDKRANQPYSTRCGPWLPAEAGSRGSDEPIVTQRGRGGIYIWICTLSSYPDSKLSDRGQVLVPSPIICAIHLEARIQPFMLILYAHACDVLFAQ